ncbi:hypothetical protein V1515DRAFT_604411 [Lipomyces mesembrius]
MFDSCCKYRFTTLFKSVRAASFSSIRKAIAGGSLKITVYKVYRLEVYRSAAEALETSLSTGKIVLKC